MPTPQAAENVVSGQHQSQSCYQSCLNCLKSPRDHQIRQIMQGCDFLINSVFWRTLIVICTILLLFGSPVQFLWTPKKADIYFDVLYSIALGVFCFDMIFNLLVDPEYFGCDLLRKGRPGQSHQPGCWPCRIGSFMFWCDVVSTGALLNDISYINKSEFEMHKVGLTLNDYGIPVDFSVVNSNVPVRINVHLIVLVFKTARVARLLPSATVLEISSRINLYWYVERLNPMWHCKKFVERKRQARRLKEEMEAKKNEELVRRASWGGLELAALAAIKAMALEKSKKKENPFISKAKITLQSLGLMRNSNVELNRHIAATKIQRAWRNRLARPTGARYEDGLGGVGTDEDAAGKGRSGAVMERALKKRSTSGQRQSGKSIRDGQGSDRKSKSGLYRNSRDTRADSQVGSAMAEVTGQRVATVILISLILTILFTYIQKDATRASTMVMLHGQILSSRNQTLADKALDAARSSSIPDLFYYDVLNSTLNFDLDFDENTASLRDREKVKIIVEDARGRTEGIFIYRDERIAESRVELFATLFVLFVWFLGVTAFAGPIMTLVIIPIERMVRLLGMLMVDPLGYQSNLRFKKFLVEEDKIVKKSQWTKEVLKGMETSFLMSTILRIGSLMKVGFGSAGVEIIRNNLQKGQNKNMLILNSQGSTVSCIFLFCDIRQFTDATECLQEEVFVFTNRIAAVVHSICHSYGGSANKNVGDAFLVSWLLEEESSSGGHRFTSRGSPALTAKNHQADKALLSVVKICMALHYDDYYVSTMSETARSALLAKLKKRGGPIVQMGFGMHAGKAVQGAIGSQRKIDATYVSEAVERAEFLESSTKQYGLKMLMSDSFHQLLHPSNRRRCRKIDQIMFENEEEEDNEVSFAQGDIMELFTYDMDIEALWRHKRLGEGDPDSSVHSRLDESTGSSFRGKDRPGPPPTRQGGSLLKKTRRLSVRNFENKGHSGSDELNPGLGLDTGHPAIAQGLMKATSEGMSSSFFETDRIEENSGKPEKLVLPTGPALYSSNVWLQDDMRRVRTRFTSGFFQTFTSGLDKYYKKDWDGARQCFEAITERFDDGPSHYFLKQMKQNNWKPPPDFNGYGKA